MAIKFSDDQLKIINSRDENLLVSAAAGSGKTAVLVERIIERVLDPVSPIDIDRILVVTFTNAAAKEMKERIQKALNDRLSENPGDAYLERQCQLIHNALITTIDSFCLYLVRNHFHQVDVDPGMRVAGELEMELVKKDILKELIQASYESEDQIFLDLVDAYSGKKDDEKIETEILRLYTYAMSYPWPDKWLLEKRGDYDFSKRDFLTSDFCKDLCKLFKSTFMGLKSELEHAIDKLHEGGVESYVNRFTEEASKFEEIEEAFGNNDFEKASVLLRGLTKERLSPATKGCDEDIKNYCKAVREHSFDEAEKIKAVGFGRSSGEIAKDLTETGKYVDKLIDLTREFMKRFTDTKRDMGVLDFNDMEHLAINILIDDYEDMDHFTITRVAEDYKEYFSEIMIDEYQDSNMVQELILKSISRESESSPNRFMVGDVKQSIYRFRLARPEIFMGKAVEYETKSSSRVINLKANFRSRPAVVDSVNAVFKRIMTEDRGGLNYTEDEYLYANADFTDAPDTEINKTEINMLISDKRLSAEMRKAEAKAIADRIEELVGSFPVKGKDGVMHPAAYRDITVLFRSPKNYIEPLKDAFNEAGIPFHAENTGAFYDSQEIKEVINLLKVLNNPLEDLPLYGTMVSFFGGFTDEKCALISADSEEKEYYLWEKLKGYIDRHEDDAEAVSFYKRIEALRKKKAYTPVSELIREIVDDTGYRFYVAAQRNGEQKTANLDLLTEKAAEFCKTSFHGVFHFIRFIELLKKVEKDDGEAGIFSEEDNSVRIMSIHKSKGLEFPICIVGDIDSDIINKDAKNSFVMDIDRGIGTDYVDPVRRVKRKTVKKYYINKWAEAANFGEELRILYVAMTRAKEKLIMFGSVSKEEDVFSPSFAKTESYFSLIKNVALDNGKLFSLNIWDECRESGHKIDADVRCEEIRDMIESSVSPDADRDLNIIRERLSYKYPHENLKKLFTKTTVSELKMKAMADTEEETFKLFEKNEAEEYIPKFMGGEEEVKGTDRGTAYHKVLELLDFTREYSDTTELESCMTELVNAEKLSREEMEKVSLSKIMIFIQSDIFSHMKAAAVNNKLYKESPFVLGMKASEVDESFPSDETILIQGVIDVYFEEAGSIVLLDYKTDSVNTEKELSDRYKTQLDYYGMAISRLTGLPVSKKLLYSFALNKTVEV
jgi:ATP-dependent helicase/nuclease subunit A